MAPISKNPGFGSGFDTFMATELSLINSMEILDSNDCARCLNNAWILSYTVSEASRKKKYKAGETTEDNLKLVSGGNSWHISQEKKPQVSEKVAIPGN